MEILAGHMDGYFKRTGIVAEKKWEGTIYGGSTYQVWQLNQKEFKKLNETKDESYQSNEWWRSAEGSNMGTIEMRYKINGHYVKAWDGEYRKQVEEENKTLPVCDRYITERAYGRLTEYFCDEIGASLERNVCALAVDLAKQNNMTMAELFAKYEN